MRWIPTIDFDLTRLTKCSLERIGRPLLSYICRSILGLGLLLFSSPNTGWASSQIDLNQGENLLLYVDSLIQTNNNELARDFLLQSLESGNNDLIPELYLRLAQIDLKLHNFNRALEEIRQLEKLPGINLNADVRFRMEYRKATIYNYMGRCDQAVELFYKLIEQMPKDAEHFHKLSRLYNGLGNAMLQLKLASADEQYQRAIEYANKAGIINFAVYNNLADFHIEHLSYRTAGKYIDSLLYFANLEGNTHNLMSGMMKKAHLYSAMGRSEEAKELMYQYRALARDQDLKIFVQDQIYDAYVYHANDQLDSAIHYAKQVVEHAIQRNENSLAVKSMTFLANLYSKSGDADAAVDIYERYISLYKDQDRYGQIATVTKRIENKNPIFSGDYWLAILALVILVALLLRNYWLRRQIDKTELTVEAAESTSLEHQEEALQVKNQLLTKMSLARQQNLDFLHQLKTDIRKLGHDKAKLQKNINSLIVKINNNVDFHARWDQVHLHFSELFPNFLSTLKEEYPKLTDTELRHCMFIKLNLTNEEIARILNIEVSSVNSARYRLKKKIDLEEIAHLS